MQVWRAEQTTRTFAAGLLGLAVGAVVLCAGCAGPEIPFGKWCGHGTFVYERWATDATADDDGAQSIHRSYPTRLSIQPGELGGREVIEMEICSERGPLPGLDDRTHLKVAFVKAKDVLDSMVLYRAVGSLFNPKHGEKMEFDTDTPPFVATGTVVDGSTVFEIQYGENFVDVMRFQGGRVEKYGSYSEKDKALVQWFEVLSRTE